MSDTKDEIAFDLKQLEEEFSQRFDKAEIEEFLSLQLTEYEMLASMFPSPGELSLDDYSVLADFNEYLNGKTTQIPQQLDYTIKLNIDEHRLDVCVTLPLEYPNLEPDIFVRSEDLTRTQQRVLNKDLAQYVSTLSRGEICILLAVSWLQEHALEYFITKTTESKKVKSSEEEDGFSRYWIYSHHIYSKNKCKEITDLANMYELTGFYLPGRPGIICFEGYSSACQECWSKVKDLSWKKITCKRIDEIKLENVTIEEARKFQGFDKVLFRGESASKKQDFHMDFGKFYKYLKDHQCEYAFKDCFGFDGK